MAGKSRRTYAPRILGSGKIMMPADLERLHKYMMEIGGISVISDEIRTVVEEAQHNRQRSDSRRDLRSKECFDNREKWNGLVAKS